MSDNQYLVLKKSIKAEITPSAQIMRVHPNSDLIIEVGIKKVKILIRDDRIEAVDCGSVKQCQK